MISQDLTEREKSILRYVIHQFIITASPVGSRNISRRYNIGLSPASVRNIMSDLEDVGLLNHPHTSAGRVPTDLGYRIYVDSLMEPVNLNKKEKKLIEVELDKEVNETEDLLKITSAILSDITKQLACVTYPKFDHAILKKIQIVRLSSSKIMVVLSIKSGLVKTITLEINASVHDKSISAVEQLLNDRLSGLKFIEIRNSFKDRVKDRIDVEAQPIIRVFLDSIDKIFTDIKVTDKALITGAKNILQHPEFVNPAHLQSIIELIEDKEIIIHIMDKENEWENNDVSIVIGEENEESKLTDYSLITKDYKIGSVSGRLGVVGPKRMEYSKVIATVVYIAEMLSKELKKQRI